MVDAFLASHAALSANYAAALTAFEASRGLDVAHADGTVKGQDRAPTDALDQLVTHLAEGLGQARIELDTFVVKAEWIGAVLILIVVGAIGAGLAWATSSISAAIAGLTEGLSEGVEQVTSAAGQVATSAQALSQGATEQAASLEETSAPRWKRCRR